MSRSTRTRQGEREEEQEKGTRLNEEKEPAWLKIDRKEHSDYEGVAECKGKIRITRISRLRSGMMKRNIEKTDDKEIIKMIMMQGSTINDEEDEENGGNGRVIIVSRRRRRGN